MARGVDSGVAKSKGTMDPPKSFGPRGVEHRQACHSDRTVQRIVTLAGTVSIRVNRSTANARITNAAAYPPEHSKYSGTSLVVARDAHHIEEGFT